MSEYHKIETLFERDLTTFKVKPGVLKNRTYSLLKEWAWTEKVDGTNIRVIWDHVAGKVAFGGKTDSAQIHADLVRYLYENCPVENLRTVFPDVSAVIYGEGYGAGIQKGGGYSDTKKLIVFDVLVDGKWWLSEENARDVAAKLHLDFVPSLGVMSLEAATEFVRAGFTSRLNGGKVAAEGAVGRPLETLFDKKGHRLIVKLKTKDFAGTKETLCAGCAAIGALVEKLEAANEQTQWCHDHHETTISGEDALMLARIPSKATKPMIVDTP